MVRKISWTLLALIALAAIAHATGVDPTFRVLKASTSFTLIPSTAHSILVNEAASPSASVGPCSTTTLVHGQGASADPNCAKVDLTTDVTNVLPPASGGTVPPVAVASLPTCNSGEKGTYAAVTDSTNTCLGGNTLTGGGSLVCGVVCDGSAWKLISSTPYAAGTGIVITPNPGTIAVDTTIIKSFVMGGTGATDLVDGDFMPFGTTGMSATEGLVSQIIPAAATISVLNCRITAATGPGTSWIFTLRKNAADTTQTCIVSNPTVGCSDLIHPITVAFNDLVDVSIVATGSPAAAKGFCSFVIHP